LRALPWCALFILIQLVSLVLQIIGIPVIGICLIASWRVPWIWWNDDDGAGPDSHSKWEAFVWLALRNPVDNLKRVPGVAGPGRPLLYHWWTSTPQDPKSGHYVKAGWESGEPYFPVCSAGAGRGY
jgi:hypothetical protein